MIPNRIVVMGVSGSGKSAVGMRLSADLGVPFIEADDFHSDANKLLMSSSIPLTDDDRWSWLDAVGAAISSTPQSITACSALKRSYRDRLREAASDLFFLELDGTKKLFADRLEGRRAHFMPSTLLESQFETLEPLQPDEDGMQVDVTPVIGRLVRSIEEQLTNLP
jgi:gluconokinase